MRQLNASWDQPYNMNFLDDKIINQITNAIIRPLKDIRAMEYLGLRYYLKYRDIRKLDFPWGWKDPRTTFTIDIWKKIFPHAKILHIYRNPIDVAESLRKREEELDSKFQMTFSKKMKEYLLKGKIGYKSSARLKYIHEGIFLWKQYIEKSLSVEKTYHDVLRIKYEDLLAEPKTLLEKIFDFTEIPYSKKDVEKSLNTFRKDRKYAFLKNDNLVKIYDEIRNWQVMKELGYDNIPC